MTAITKVKWINVPDIKELNAVLFDMQEDGANIIDVKEPIIEVDGSLRVFVIYHLRDEGAIEKDANRDVEETSEESSEDVGSSI